MQVFLMIIFKIFHLRFSDGGQGRAPWPAPEKLQNCRKCRNELKTIVPKFFINLLIYADLGTKVTRTMPFRIYILIIMIISVHFSYFYFLFILYKDDCYFVTFVTFRDESTV